MKTKHNKVPRKAILAHMRSRIFKIFREAMPPDPPSRLKNFSRRFAAIKIFKVAIRTGQILGWIRPCNTFNVISSIYNKYKPNDRKSYLSYSFVLKKLLIMLGKVEYAKYIPQLKTHSKQKELERVWELITKDHEWVVALQKRKIS